MHKFYKQARSKKDAEMEELFGSDESDGEAADRPKKARKRRTEDGAPRKRPKKEAADGAPPECMAECVSPLTKMWYTHGCARRIFTSREEG